MRLLQEEAPNSSAEAAADCVGEQRSKLLPKSSIVAAAAAALACSGLAACDDAGPATEPTTRAEPQPGSAPAGPDGIQIAYAIDGDTITVEGKVLRIEGPSLLLDYGTGEIPVMLKGGALPPGSLQSGEEVKVAGIYNVRPDGPSISAVQLLVQGEGDQWVPATSAARPGREKE